jgi:UDPglucose 6-dehydrogenase
MNIAVIGCGFVGGTVADFLEGHLVNVWRVDPNLYPHTEISYGIKDCDAFIVCVPTPENKDGTCDDSIVKLVIEELDTDKPILLKSTVTPDLMEKYPGNVTYNPEFLRANSAKEDFAKQEVFILGAVNPAFEEQLDFWSNLFMPFLPNTLEKRMTRTDAAMVKYTHNAWLATKVAFFHELFLNTKHMQDFNYSTLTSTLGYMKNIGPSHMIAPNFDGKLGFGGHCFPKDTKALTKTVKHSILSKVIETNKELNR